MKAVVFIDVQNDFVTGSLGSKWAQEVAPKIIEFANECRDKGYLMYATLDTHNLSNDDDYSKTLEGKNLPVTHCAYGTHGHKLIDGLQFTKDDKKNIYYNNCINKPTFGSFNLLYALKYDFESSFPDDNCYLDSYTHPLNPSFGRLGESLDEIIICGFVTSICVISNALMLRAKFPNVKITLRSDLCADINEESHQAALTVMRNCQINVE